MNEIVRIMETELKYLIRLKEEFVEERDRLPIGRLRRKMSRGKQYWYLYVSDDDGHARWKSLGVDGGTVRREIERRDNVYKVIRTIQANRVALEFCLKRYKELGATTEWKMMEELRNRNKGTSLLEQKEDGWAVKLNWDNLRGGQNRQFEEACIHLVGNMRVRSKSEIIIITLLEKYGIEYKYEVCIEIDGVWYSPDFAVKHPKTGNILLWEHFGMTNNENYVQKMERKIAAYRFAGLTLWDNLLISWDRPDGAIDAVQIEKMIRLFLL